MRPSVRPGLVSGLLALWCGTAAADPPSIKALFPAGGQRGTDVRVTIQGKVAALERLQLHAPESGVSLLGSEGKDALTLKLDAAAPTGVAWLRFFDPEGAAELRPFVIGQLTEQLETEPNNSLAEATPLGTLPVTINGALSKAGDVDGFAVPLTAGQTLWAGLVSREGLGSPADAILQIVSPDGFVVAQNDDAQGFDPQLAWQAASPGNYTVRVFGFPATPDSSIRLAGGADFIYRLTITTGPVLTALQPAAVTAGVASRLRPTGWNLPADQPELDGPLLPAGLHDWAPAGWSSSTWLHVTPHTVLTDVEPSSRAEPRPAAIPATLAGVLQSPKDDDAWRITAQKGDRLLIRALARHLGSPADVVLRVDGPNGQRLQEVDDRVEDEFDAVLDFKVPADGDYVLSVAERFAHCGPAYGYVIDISTAAPDVQLQLKTDAVVVKPNAPAKWTVDIDRRRGFDQPLTLHIEGLPEGCTADTATSEPKGNSSKSVTLTVTSMSAAAWSGPVRIIGRTAGDPPREWLARVPAAGASALQAPPWLTIVMPPAP